MDQIFPEIRIIRDPPCINSGPYHGAGLPSAVSSKFTLRNHSCSDVHIMVYLQKKTLQLSASVSPDSHNTVIINLHQISFIWNSELLTHCTEMVWFSAALDTVVFLVANTLYFNHFLVLFKPARLVNVWQQRIPISGYYCKSVKWSVAWNAQNKRAGTLWKTYKSMLHHVNIFI